MRILGLDPGSRVTGYGLVEERAGRFRHLASGCLRPAGEDHLARLGSLFLAAEALLAELRPAEVAIERVFVQRNPESALKLGQARGALLGAVAARGLKVAEYSPAEIKQALVGSGRAQKAQVQHMVRSLLGLEEAPAHDAADALACALCHGQTRRTLSRLPAGYRSRPRRPLRRPARWGPGR